MKLKNLFMLFVVNLSACSDSSDSESLIENTTLLGNVFKGPIDEATIYIKDAEFKTIASSRSDQGKFEFYEITLPADSEVVFISTEGGSFTDEATDKTVLLKDEGLMAVSTASILRTVISDNKRIALTPETTIVAKLVKNILSSSDVSVEEAIKTASSYVQDQLIDNTNPASMISGDTIMTVADLTAAVPANSAEALARNRAIAFSYEVERLKLLPVQVFELINSRALDLQDGILDGKQGDKVLSITDKTGAPLDLGSFDQNVSYALSRRHLLNNTMQRLTQDPFNSELSSILSNLGFDADQFSQQISDNKEALETTQTRLSANNLPMFNHLTVLNDEDGSQDNLAATYTLTATADVNVTVYAPGDKWLTPMLRYNGSQLPLVIRAKRGDTMTLKLENNLPSDDTTIHWHGFKIPGDQDGGADFPVAAGSSKIYSFKMQQAAAPLWFHPHPDMKTGEQVYGGLTGVFLLEDEITKELEANKQLPYGLYDIPILVQDRRFKDKVSGVRELVYMDNLAMDKASGMLGDHILVNGSLLPKLDVTTRQYRFRIYNASNARTYDFALSDGTTFTAIATDGGLLSVPVVVDHLMLAPAERAEIVINFAQYSAGNTVMLISQAFNGNMMNMMGMGAGGMGDGGMGGGGMGDGGMDGGGMGGGGMGGGGMENVTPNGMYLDIMRFDIAAQSTDDITLYSELPADAEIKNRLLEDDSDKTRNFVLSMGMGNMGSGNMGGNSGSGAQEGGMSFTINGKEFDMKRSDEVIRLADGDTEIWSIQNMSPMAHPFHAHAIQWQVLDRNGKPAEGVDLGWKDTVLVQPGSTVRIIGRFEPIVNFGNYMYHCHILEHEDAGMMGNFRIE